MVGGKDAHAVVDGPNRLLYGKGPRGRPRKRWLEDMEEKDLEKMGVTRFSNHGIAWRGIEEQARAMEIDRWSKILKE